MVAVASVPVARMVARSWSTLSVPGAAVWKVVAAVADRPAKAAWTFAMVAAWSAADMPRAASADCSWAIVSAPPTMVVPPSTTVVPPSMTVLVVGHDANALEAGGASGPAQ